MIRLKGVMGDYQVGVGRTACLGSALHARRLFQKHTLPTPTPANHASYTAFQLGSDSPNYLLALSLPAWGDRIQTSIWRSHPRLQWCSVR
jgi:hypothetical protein